MRRTRLVVILTVGLGLVGAPGSIFAGSFPAKNDGLPNWAPTFMQWPIGLDKEEAVDFARRYDVIAATKRTFRAHARAMQQANPNLKMLVYQNGAFAQKDQATAFPEEWYARDAQGRKITENEFGNYLMDVSHPEWIDHVEDECVRFLEFSGYEHGCLIDVLGDAPVTATYVSVLPINPRTGKEWTPRQWLKATSHIAGRVQDRIRPSLVVPNGIAWGADYWDDTAPSRWLLGGTSGGMVELFIRPPRAPINTYRPEEDWRKDVDMLADAGCSDSFLAVTKVWVDAARAQKDAWHKYALASFLLGDNGRSYFTFLYERDVVSSHPWANVDVGPPAGGYAKRDGVYQRDFRDGRALVNPTSESYVVELGGTYRDLNGIERSSVVLGPHSGEVLFSEGSSDQVVHETCVSLKLQGELVAKGRVTVADGFAGCLRDTEIRVQRRKRGRWVTVGKTSTGRRGAYRVKVADRRGKYRAVLPVERKQSADGLMVCEKDLSPARLP